MMIAIITGHTFLEFDVGEWAITCEKTVRPTFISSTIIPPTQCNAIQAESDCFQFIGVSL